MGTDKYSEMMTDVLVDILVELKELRRELATAKEQDNGNDLRHCG